uniref:Metallo-beta-lactamase domain-containing protein 1 n=1 Tax=Erpetoichthys calabaricus TaxID=27687 RepID=A0A8C4RNL6_ERPCA
MRALQLPALSTMQSTEIKGNPYSVSVIKEGYSFTDHEGNSRADGTITLISGPVVILVDTGGPWDRLHILNALASRGMQPEDVSYVICTHGHSDHVGNLNLFQSATIAVSFDISQGDTYLSHELAEGKPFIIDQHVEILPTPGHTGSDTSVLVRGTELGTVAVVGDLFENYNDEDGWRAVSENSSVQQCSRQRVMEIANVIIPGHGGAFQVYHNNIKHQLKLKSNLNNHSK